MLKQDPGPGKPPKRVAIPREGFMSKARFEAFTDGVFAIAITLLVLEIHLPPLDSIHTNADMLRFLSSLVPSLLTYVLSFITVGVIWLNHHSTYLTTKYLDRTTLLLNLILLLTVCFVPYPTALLAEYPALPSSTAFYGLVFFLMGTCYAALWWYSASVQHRIDPNIPALTMQRRFMGIIGTFFYLLGTIVAFWAPKVSVGIYILVTLYYMMPGLFRRHPGETTPEID